MWRPTRYSDDDFAAFREAMERLAGRGRSPSTLIYLINPAAQRPGDAAQVADVADPCAAGRRRDRCHGSGGPSRGAQGRHRGATRASARSSLIKEALARTERCPICYENTAGSPQLLGRDFDETAELIDKTGGPKRLGLCIDTCHLYATGYDIATPEGIEATSSTRSTRRSASSSSSCLHVNDAADPLRLQPRPPRADRQGRDRAEGLPRLPRRAPPAGRAGGAGGAGHRRARRRQEGRAAHPPPLAGGDTKALTARSANVRWARPGICDPGRGRRLLRIP